MSAESHLFCQLTRDLPIYFTFQMNCSLFCHSGILFCNLFCGPWQVENEPWFSPVWHVNCQLHGSTVCLQDQGTWPCIWGGRGARLCNPTAAGGDSAVTRRKYFFSFLPATPLGSMAKDKLCCANLSLKCITAKQRCSLCCREEWGGQVLSTRSCEQWLRKHNCLPRCLACLFLDI